ncbi:hypothetical protein N9924_01250 [bacterium]|nr:hypothetical protein [bacterium]
MGLLAGIASVFSSSPDKVLDMAGGVGEWINNANFTEEEQSKANQKLLEWKLKWMNATQGQNLARRYCAIMFGVNYILSFQVCLWALLVDFVKSDTMIATEFVNTVIDLALSFQMGWIMLSIISFYFLKEGVPTMKNIMAKGK